MRYTFPILLFLLLAGPAQAQGDGRVTLETLREQLRHELPEGVKESGSDVSATEGQWFVEKTEVLQGSVTLLTPGVEYPMQILIYSQAGLVDGMRLSYRVPAEDAPLSIVRQRQLWEGLRDYLRGQFGYDKGVLIDPAGGPSSYDYWDEADNNVLLFWIADGELTLWIQTRSFSLDRIAAEANYNSAQYDDEEWW